MTFNTFFSVFLTSCLCLSCIEDKAYQIPAIECDNYNISSNYTLKEIHDQYNRDYTIEEDRTIEGVIISSDKNGSFYKTLIFQSLDNKYGISVFLDDTYLYQRYEPNRKVLIKLKNLQVKKTHEQFNLSYSNAETLDRIPLHLLDKHILVSCELAPVERLVNRIKINDISDENLNTLVEVENVQFIPTSVNSSFYDPENDSGGSTNHYIEDNNGYRIIVRVNKYTSFSNQTVPMGNGTIRGVLTKYRDDYQLILRGLDGIQFSNPRQIWSTMTIQALKNRNQDEVFTTNRYITGVITLSGYTGNANHSQNLSERTAILQDESTGIVLYFDEDAHKLNESDEVKVFLENTNTDTFAGQTRLEYLDFNRRIGSGENQIQIISTNNPLPIPKEVTIEELNNHQFVSELVSLKNIQIIAAEQGLTFSGKKTLTDCKNSIYLNTRTDAAFSSNPLPRGNGTITAIANIKTSPELILISNQGTRTMDSEKCANYTLIFEENFETYSVTEIALQIPNWINHSENNIATKWQIKSFSGNNYAEISAYETNEVVNSWLISPSIDLQNITDAYLQFRTKDGYNNGAPLSVYLSTDFDGTNIQNATWVLLSPIISSFNGFGYAPSFIHSSKIDLSTYSSTIYIAFKYSGDSDGVTTTIQVDEFQILGNINN